ncbi:hypothetical protein ACFW04_007452 [Cataglyphis niger]
MNRARQVFIFCFISLFYTRVFRHGNRPDNNGYEMFPTDPHINYTFFPIGLGQLTNQGKKCEYELGQVLRSRYKDFLGDLYLPNLVVGRSLDYDRTKMSLQLILTALFVDEYTSILNLPEIKKEISQFKDMISKLTELTGKNIETTLDLYYLYNTFVSELSMNLTLPKWAHDYFPHGSMELYLYSGHEINVASMLHAFNLYKLHVPEYSSIILKLLQQDKQYYVKFLHYRDIPPIIDELQIPSCEILCNSTNFWI